MIVNGSPLESGQFPPVPQNDAAVARSVIAPAPAPVVVESAESLRDAVAAINRAAKSLNNNVELSLDTQSGRTLVRVIDSETGQLLRQIPSEEALELRRALERIAGLLIHRTA